MGEVRFTTVAAAAAGFGGVVLIVALFSRRIRSTYFSAPLAGMLLGIALSPFATAAVDITAWADALYVLEIASWLTLAIGLMASALDLPRFDVLQRWRELAVLLGLLNPIMWGVGTLLVYLILRPPFLVALLAGAALAPTDPILAGAIVQGEVARQNIPERLRNLLSAESGANDGLALPFVLLGVNLVTRPYPQSLVQWVLSAVLLSVFGAVGYGIAAGYGAGWALNWACRHEFVTSQYFLAYTVALSLVSLATGHLFGFDGVLVVFITGLAFVIAFNCPKRMQAHQRDTQRAFEVFFMLPTFLLFGLDLPWHDWFALGWRALAIVAAILALRRLPAVFVLGPLLRRQIVDGAEKAFYGWFGPMGVSALYYVTLIVSRTGLYAVWPIVSLVIASSVVAHGVSAAPLSLPLGRHIRGRPDPEI